MSGSIIKNGNYHVSPLELITDKKAKKKKKETTVRKPRVEMVIFSRTFEIALQYDHVIRKKKKKEESVFVLS